MNFREESRGTSSEHRINEYSTLWEFGGPLIEVYNVELLCYNPKYTAHNWEAQLGGVDHYIDQYPGDAIDGPTPLIAAMRAIVADKLGEEIDVPEELIK